MSDEEETDWSELGIVCPHCGNAGQPNGAWCRNARVPFKLTEQVYRSWEFSATLKPDGVLDMTADSDTDEVDWESGDGERFACMQCFGEFPLPADSKLDFV